MLITGGAGFIGSHTAVLLLDRGYGVSILDSFRPPVHERPAAPPWLPKDVKLLVGDVRDREALCRALRESDRVLHLAAYQDYLQDFSTFFHINTVGTALLYEICVQERLDIRKIVVASSQAIYGEGRYVCSEHGVFYPGMRAEEQLRRGEWEIRCGNCARQPAWEYTDETFASANNQYGISKYTQELVAFNLGRRYGIPTTCMRYSITQGRWQSPRNAYSGICRTFVARALSGKPPLVYEDGLQRRDYVHVSDVARANLVALEDARTDFEAYNVGGAQALTALDYADLVRRALGLEAPALVPGYYRFGDTRHIVSDISKLRHLGWQPTLSVAEIVNEYAEWLSESGYTDCSIERSMAAMLTSGTLRQVWV